MKRKLEDVGGSYTFSALDGTITFFNIILDITNVLLITNVTSGDQLYLFNDSSLGGSFSGNILHLTKDTSAMNDTDALQIFIDVPNSLPVLIKDVNRNDGLGEVSLTPTANTLLGRLKDVSDLLNKFEFDPISGFLATSLADHVERHEGEMWVVSYDYTSGNAGTAKYFAFKAGALVESHLTYNFISDDKFYLRLFYAPTITSDGVSIGTISNIKTSLPNSSSSLLYEDTTFSIKGNQIDFSYSNKVEVLRERELIIDPNDYLLMEITPDKDNIQIGINLEWYEEVV